MRTIKQEIATAISSFLYIGFIRPAPGTFGSLGAVMIIHLLFEQLVSSSLLDLTIIYILLLPVVVFAVGIYSKQSENKDPSEVVIDEVYGVLSAVIVIWFFVGSLAKLDLVWIFVFFRLIDILKPFPVGWVDKNIKNSFGVIFDDIVAGIITGFLICLLH